MKLKCLLKQLSSFYYRFRYRNLYAYNSLLFDIKISGGGNGSKLIFKDSHVSRFDFISKGTNNIIKFIGCGVYHGPTLTIVGSNNNVEFDECCALSNMNITIKGNGCTVKIGSKTTSNGTSIYCIGDKNEVIIGCDCMLAADTEIWSSDSHTIVDVSSKQVINKARESVYIGNHVWLAEHVKVLKGVNIADNCILGMGCVMTKNAEHNCIYAGIPARKIKEGVDWKREY